MCRFAAHAGSSAPLSALLLDAPRSLEVQAWDPRQQISGHVNVDGTGIAWWDGESSAPLRYVSERPPWSDPNVRSLLPRLAASMHLAVVRGATPGMPCGPNATPPFVLGDLALAHNGYLERFAEVSLRPLLERLDDDLLARLDVVSDTAVILLTLERLRREGRSLVDAVAATLVEVGALAKAGGIATLNLLVGDGTQLVATRHAENRRADSLWVHDAHPALGGALVASEPLDDDDRWREAPEGSLVRVGRDGNLDVRSLESAA